MNMNTTETYDQYDDEEDFTRMRLIAKDAFYENKDAADDYEKIPYEERLAAFLSQSEPRPPVMPWIAVTDSLIERGYRQVPAGSAIVKITDDLVEQLALGLHVIANRESNYPWEVYRDDFLTDARSVLENGVEL